jgi:hypothetical protein
MAESFGVRPGGQSAAIASNAAPRPIDGSQYKRVKHLLENNHRIVNSFKGSASREYAKNELGSTHDFAKEAQLDYSSKPQEQTLNRDLNS